MMLNPKYYILLFLLVFVKLPTIFSQGDIEDLLYTEVDNLNPVYKPVIGFGMGNFNYYGDVRDPKQNPFNGTLGYKVMLTTFIDNKHYIRADFFFMGGTLSGNERSHTDLSRNMNFNSNVMQFGFDLNYDFDNFYKKYRKVHPFISVGFETMTFNSKTDDSTTIEGVSVRYNYWSDGTIRNMPETAENKNNPSLRMINRDYTYETNLRQAERGQPYNWGLGKYPQYSFAIPIDVGLDFWLSDRVMFRVATSYHITFTDVIDHVSSKNTSGVVGDKKNDNFMFSYFSLHLDLFSSKKTLAVQRLFADIEFDPTLMSDEDNDGWFDGWDQCPGTPLKVQTDTTGCPLDDDFDGIPNYIDDEPNSRYGAFVNERGVEFSEDELIAKLDMSNAVNREDAELFIRTPSSYSRYKDVTAKEIPEKFNSVDKDKDGYISFDEIMKEIDNFFDFKSNLSSEDIYELNNFFFAQ
jgi:hypothetical protein